MTVGSASSYTGSSALEKWEEASQLLGRKRWIHDFPMALMRIACHVINVGVDDVISQTHT